jgi:hypothetical protein
MMSYTETLINAYEKEDGLIKYFAIAVGGLVVISAIVQLAIEFLLLG